MRKIRSLAVGIAGLLIFVCGCAANPVPVEGVVTLDGKPLAGAEVIFAPEQPGENGSVMAVATADDQGVFRLNTHNARGAFPGRYKVTISHRALPTNVPEPKNPEEAMSVYKLRKDVVPAQYAKYETTPLQAEVPRSGVTDLRFDLTSK
jgi:hypothetical protein